MDGDGRGDRRLVSTRPAGSGKIARPKTADSILTSGGFSPDGVQDVLPTVFDRFFRLHAEGPTAGRPLEGQGRRTRCGHGRSAPAALVTTVYFARYSFASFNSRRSESASFASTSSCW
jgi:hypothetical protein